MKTIGWGTCLVALALLAGCGLAPAKIPTASNYVLCIFYADHHDPAIRAELVKRQIFSPQEWQLIDAQQVAVGESEDAMFCALGIQYDSHTTTTAGGDHTQFVFQHIGLVDTYTYVYVDNGVVTAVQN